jgi:electron transport complex protein RnfD
MSNGNKEYIVSASPHAHENSSVRRIMLDVIIALIPATIVSIVLFGMDAARLLAVCVISCVVLEFACRKAMGRDTGVGDLSAVVTGILIAFNLPPALPWWMAFIGCVFAIVIAKQLFGGLGYNPFNPALIGRVALTMSFPVAMTTWSQWRIPSPLAVDATTHATPLGLVKTSLQTTGEMPYEFGNTTAMQFFLGNMNGCIGEVSAAALLLGGVYLLIRRCITWHIPVAYLGTVLVFSGVLWAFDKGHNMPPLFHLLAGGLMLGAIYMATDMVTSPVTRSGMLIFGVGCGVLTMLIRKWGAFPEGVSFSILLMNSVVPLINRATKPRVLGTGKAGKS